MHITYLNIKLRAVEETDLEIMQIWANNPAIQINLGGWHFPTNKNDQQKWFQNLNCNSNHQRFIVENELHCIVGMANLLNINFKDGNAEVGLIIDPAYQNQGFGHKIINALMFYGFNQLRLNRLETTIIAINQPSLNLFIQKCNWKVEGIQRKWYFRNGQFIDRYLLSILKEEFEQNNE